MNTFRCGVCTTDNVTLIRTCTYRGVTRREFFPRCPQVNLLCSELRGAYVASVTVCRQRLF